MNSNFSKTTIVSGLFWRFLERIGAQGVHFVVSIVLARILAPELFGIITLINVFIAILEVFVDSGLGNALIQKKDADDLDFSTVFYFNLASCCVLYFSMFLAAPFISRFYKMPELTSAIRAISFILVISGVKNVQQAYVSRTMQFKRFFYATLGGTIGAAILGIWMAYAGFGLWALIAQSLFNTTVDTIILWITVKWRPKKMFSFRRLKSLLSYGGKLLVSALLDTIYNKVRQLIIGRMYTPANLAFYEKGGNFPAVITNNINTSINSVLFPAMSSVQDDREAVKRMTRQSIVVCSYILWPLMMGLAACAEPLVVLILTEKWLPCVFYLRIFCIIYAFYPVHTANLNAIKALGRSDIFLKLETMKKVIGMLLLFISMWFGVEMIAYSLLISTVASVLINSWPNRRMLNYSYLQQIKDILPSILLSSIMSIIVWSVQFLHLGVMYTLIIQVIVGFFVYFLGSLLFNLEGYSYVVSIMKRLLNT